MAKILVTLSVLACSLWALVPSASAAKVVTTWTVSSAVTDFEVDDQGSLFQITTAQSDTSSGKRLATVTWQLAIVSGGKQSVFGNGFLTQSDFPPDAVDCTIAGYYRRKVLLHYTDAQGDPIYAIYQIQTNKLKISQGIFYIAMVGETMTFQKNVVIDVVAVAGVESVRQYNTNFKLFQNKTIVGFGDLTAIEYRVPNYWKDISGSAGADKTVRVLRQ